VAIKHVPINKMCELDDLVRFVEEIVETAIEHFGLTGLLRIVTWMHVGAIWATKGKRKKLINKGGNSKAIRVIAIVKSFL
jgi:hypothetical protein